MLMHFEADPVIAPGHRTSEGAERADVRRFKVETPIQFDRLTLYAQGWRLHDASVGGVLLMLSWDDGALVGAPLTFKVRGNSGSVIALDLSPQSLAAIAPYIIVRPAAMRPAWPGGPLGGRRRKRRGAVLVIR